jgi:hypothetical protein
MDVIIVLVYEVALKQYSHLNGGCIYTCTY